MRARDALEVLAEVKTMLNRPGFARFLTAIWGAEDERFISEEKAAVLVDVWRQALSTDHHTYFLADQMSPVVHDGAEMLDADEKLTTDMWPARSGLVVIDRGRVSLDSLGKRIVTKAVAWFRYYVESTTVSSLTGQESKTTLPVAFLVDLGDTEDSRDETLPADDVSGRAIIRAIGRYAPISMQMLPDGYPVGPSRLDPDNAREQVANIAYADDFYPTENPVRWAGSFLHMLTQQITATRREVLAPKQAARFAKRDLPTDVTIVNLRPIKHVSYPSVVNEDGNRIWKWRHRTVVRGHWRNQPTGPNYPGTQEVAPGQFVARIWINSYVAGPDGAPIIAPNMLYAVTR